MVAVLPGTIADGDLATATQANQMITERVGNLRPIHTATREYTNATYDLGSATYKWKSGYFSDSIYLNTAKGIFCQTADGADNGSISFCGGGAYGDGRGSNLLVSGNEHADRGAWYLIPGLGDNAATFGYGEVRNANGDIIVQFGNYTAKTYRHVLINDNANTKNLNALTINQLASYDEIVSLKSSDVGHPMTGVTEADTFGYDKKISATLGGRGIYGLSDGDGTGLLLYGVIGSADPTDTDAAVEFYAGKWDSGTGITDLGAAERCYEFFNHAASLLTIAGNGNIGIYGSTITQMANQNTTITAYTGKNVTIEGVTFDGGELYTVAQTITTISLAVSGGTAPAYATNKLIYKQIGKTVYCWLYLDSDGGAEGNGASTLTFTLPINADDSFQSAAAVMPIGSGRYFNNATFSGITVYLTDTTTGFFYNNTTGVSLAGNDQNNATRGIHCFFYYDVA